MNIQRIIIGSLLLFFLTQTSKVQSQFRFISKFTYINGCTDNVYKRDYFSDSVFVEKYCTRTNIIAIDSDYVATDTFKVVNGKWWYCLKGSFLPFFSIELFRKGEVTKRFYNDIPNVDEKKISTTCIGYLPFKKEIIGNKEIFIFKVSFNGCDKKDFDNVNTPYYYFDPDIGFVRKKVWTCNMSEISIIEEN